MSFYSTISDFYSEIFPYREPTFKFLQSFINHESSVLDIGCGTGEYASRISETTEYCMGIDPNPEMIKKANERNSNCNFIEMDTLKLADLSNNFSLAYSVGNVASYFSEEYFNNVLKLLKERIKSEGKWVFQTVNWEKLKQIDEFDFPDIMVQSNNIKFTRKYRRLNSNEVNFEISLSNCDEIFYKSTDKLFSIPVDRIIELHKENGFKLVHHFGDFKKNGFSEQSPASIYVFENS